jgi:hypothetical protein
VTATVSDQTQPKRQRSVLQSPVARGGEVFGAANLFAARERWNAVSDSKETIGNLLVKFLAVIKKHTSDRTSHVHYKLCAEIKTGAVKEKHEYWYVENSHFLRQKSQGEAKAVRIGFSEKQRSQIVALVKKFEKNA